MISWHYVRAVFLLAPVAIILSAGQVHAEIRTAFAWANRAAADSYAPSVRYAKGDDAGVRVTRKESGVYRVTLGSLLAGAGHVQVSAYGATANVCQIDSWSGAGANVRCFDPAGRPADTLFTILAIAAEGDDSVAYVWADRPEAETYAPRAQYARSPDREVLIARTSPGRYTVDLSPSIVTTGATVQVTPYGAVPRRCGVMSWGGGRANVQCVDMSGRPSDTPFTLLAVKGGRHDAFAFLWADRASTASYSPNPAYAYVPGAEPHVRRTSRGRYEVTLSAEIGNLQVTAYGAPGILCNPVSWGPVRASIACYGPSGQPADARFTVLSTRRPESLLQVDLAVTFAGLPTILRPGDSLGPSARAVARNLGTAVAPGNRTGQRGYVVDVVLSTDRQVPEGFAVFRPTFVEDVLLRGGRASNTPDIGGRSSAILDIANDAVPEDTPDGDYYLCARIDPGDAVAEGDESNNTTCQSVQVQAGEPDIALRPAEAASPISLQLDQRFYADGDRVRASLDLGTAFVSGDVEGVLLVSEETGDLEHLVMRRTGGSTFADGEPSVVRTARSDAASRLDGRLAAQPGERIVALFYPDSARHRTSSGGLVADVAIFESAAGRNDATGAPLTAAVSIEPSLAALDRALSAAGERPFGSLLVAGTMPVQVATDAVVFRPRDAADLDAFLAFVGGEVLSAQPASAEGTDDGPEDRIHLVSVDLSRARPDALVDMRRLFGESADLLVADEATRRLYALLLEARMRGFAAAANQRILYMAAPRSTETASGALTRTMRRITPSLDVPAAWAFNALWDGDDRRINVAFIDMGFITDHPDFRRPAAGVMRECNYDDGFSADIIARGGNCGPGAAAGTPTVGNSFFGDRKWHGTGSVITAGGVLNNRWVPGGAITDRGGAAGVAGQVLVPMLYKMGLSSFVYEIGAAMRQAVDDGASCINISAAYPCRVQSSILPDVDICTPGGREVLCLEVLGAASAAAASVCASAGALAAIPIVGPIVAGPAIAACTAATAAVPVSLPSCQTFFFASGDVRSAMRIGAEHAEARGVPITSSAGNQLDEEDIPAVLRPFIDLDEIDSGVWGMIPPTLPTVISVGATSADLMLQNLHFAGESVAIWAPIPSRFHAPEDVDRVPTLTADFVRRTAGGTSAAAPFTAGVIALMQAIDPSLDPRSPGLSPAARATIPSRIRALLTSTAGASPDPLVRAVVSPNGAIREAARRAGVPTLAGYDTSLDMGETGPAAQDTAATARPIAPGDTATGTILTLKGAGGAPTQRDTDWYEVALPATPASGHFELRLRLRTPSAARWGHLRIDGWTLATTTEISAHETVKVFTRQRLRPGSPVPFAVRGHGDEDNVYQITVGPPRHTPIRSDPFEPRGPRLDSWQLVGETFASKTWVLSEDRLTLHRDDDVDEVTFTGLPPSEAFGPIPSGACQPRLEIAHPDGIHIDYSDDAGNGPFTFDPRRRERPTAPPSGTTAHPVSVMTYPTADAIPTTMSLTYRLMPGELPLEYEARATFVTVEPGAAGICRR